MVARLQSLEFDTLVGINKQVVSLTGDPHGYTPEDDSSMRSLLKRVEELDDIDDRKALILNKAALLILGIASGQHFHEGNKRTALVAGLAFLEMNGYKLDIKDPRLVSVVDKAGIAAAVISDVRRVVEHLTSESPKKVRVDWENTIKGIVDANKDFLVYIGSEHRTNPEETSD